MRRRAARLLACAVVLAACGADPRREDRAALDALYAEAETAFSRRAHPEAEAAFRRIEATGSAEAKALGTYRRAQIRLREDDVAGAVALFEQTRASGAPERAALAEWRLGRLDIEVLGRPDEGRARLQALVESAPMTGAADRAARYLALRRAPDVAHDRTHDRAIVQWLDRVSTELAETSVADNACFWAAWVRLNRLGDLGGARHGLRDFIARFSRRSALVDDAHWILAGIERRQGRVDAAIGVYEAFLALRRAAGTWLGDYRSNKLDDAAHMIGALHFHERGDLDAAERAFQRVLDEFPTSRWRDDAMWGLAGIAALRGQEEARTEWLHRLLEQHGDSRFADAARAALDGRGPTLVRRPGSLHTGLSDPRRRGDAL